MEKAMAPHSSTLVWKIPWMKEQKDTAEEYPTSLVLSQDLFVVYLVLSP